MAKEIETTAPLQSVFKRLKEGEKIKVVAYGTSLTELGPWVKLMKDWFEEQYPGQVEVINSGGSGQNSIWGKTNVQKKVVDHQPDLVLIEFSYNDAHQKFKITPEASAENLEEIAQAITTANPKVALVVQTMNAPWNPPAGKGMADSETNRPNLAEYNKLWLLYAKAHEVAVADHYPKWLEIKEKDFERYKAYVPDGSHPNKLGSERVTWPGLEALFTAAAK